MPKRFSSWSFILTFIALSAVQISYCLGGISFLDIFLFLLVPAFFLFLFDLFKSWGSETKDYCVGLVMILACVIFSFYIKHAYEVGTMDDGYHNAKIVALSIQNSFFTKFQYINPQGTLQYYLPDFIESIWGIFWRYTQWDFIVNIVQALPIIVLWNQLVQFFRNQKITTIPALLAALVVISLQTLWCSQGSTYVDSVAGILGGISLLLCFDVLSFPDKRRLFSLAGLAFVSGLCLVSKPTVYPIGLLGILTSLFLGLRLNAKEKTMVFLSSLPSILYFLYFEMQLLFKKVNLIYPVIHPSGTVFEGWYAYYYRCSGFHYWIQDHLFNLMPFHIIVQWLEDCGLVTDLTPDPWVGGNGLIFPYVVIPTLIIWLFVEHRRIFNFRNYKKPNLLVLALILIFYLFFDGSIGPRFSLSFNMLILSWCLAWAWRKLEARQAKWRKAVKITAVCILILMATVSYCEAVSGSGMEKRLYSYLYAQRQIFPQYKETSDIRKFVIKELSPQASPN